MREFRRPVRLERRSRALLLRSDVSANTTGRCRADCEDYRFFQTLCNEWVNHWNRCGRARRDSGTEMSASPPTDGVSDLPATRARYVRFAPKATVCHQAANLSLSAISGLMQCSKRRTWVARADERGKAYPAFDCDTPSSILGLIRPHPGMTACGGTSISLGARLCHLATRLAHSGGRGI